MASQFPSLLPFFRSTGRVLLDAPAYGPSATNARGFSVSLNAPVYGPSATNARGCSARGLRIRSGSRRGCRRPGGRRPSTPAREEAPVQVLAGHVATPGGETPQPPPAKRSRFRCTQRSSPPWGEKPLDPRPRRGAGSGARRDARFIQPINQARWPRHGTAGNAQRDRRIPILGERGRSVACGFSLNLRPLRPLR